MQSESDKSNTTNRPDAAGKVGSDLAAAKKFGGQGDFGVPEVGHEVERAYVSNETRGSDPGGRAAHSGSDGNRTSGVGGHEGGAGNSSGGDIDTDIIGVGTHGRTISQSGPDDRTSGADMTSARSDETRPQSVEREFVRGSTIDAQGDVATTGSAGAGAVTNPNGVEDDAFAGEMNMGEASEASGEMERE